MTPKSAARHSVRAAIALSLASLIAWGLLPVPALAEIAEEAGAEPVVVEVEGEVVEVGSAGADDQIESTGPEEVGVEPATGTSLEEVEPIDAHAIEEPDDVAKNATLEIQGASVSNPRTVVDSSMEAGQVATWDCVWFGSYPQSEVVPTDAIYASLETATWDAGGDATVGGVRYHRITRGDVCNDNSWEDGAPTYRFFRYEPIKWRVLGVIGSTALVMADTSLDCSTYCDTKVGAVSWETSSLRSWLNGHDTASGGFINMAFSSAERSYIVESALNDVDSDGVSRGKETTDRVFLLSEHEMKRVDYGFVNDYYCYDEARRSKTSDYANALGAFRDSGDAYEGNTGWWLRHYSSAVDSVTEFGSAFVDRYCTLFTYGAAVRPVLRLNLASPFVPYAGTVSSNGAVNEVPVTFPKQLTSVSLSQTTYIYDGKAKKPLVTVVADGETVPASGFDVKYASNTNAGTATVTVTGKGNYTGSKSATFTIAKATNPIAAKAAKASVSVKYSASKASVTSRNVTVTQAQGAVAYANASTDATAKKLKVDAKTGKVTVSKGTKAGTCVVKVKATAAGNANYKAGSQTVSYKVVVKKATNPLTAKAVARTASAKKLKSKAVTVARPLSVSKAQGKVTYAKVAKGSSAALTVNKKTGKVTVKKGTKVGKYTIKIKVTAAGNKNYKAGSKTVSCKVIVK